MGIFQSGFLTAGQPIQVATLEFLLVGGGGGGGSTNQFLPGRAFDAAGGGGAGGFVTSSLNFYEKQPSINVIVGASGSGPSSTNANGNPGGETSFYTFSATGGGEGGYLTAGSGGSGGGGGVVFNQTSPRDGGSGIVGQGNNGGSGRKTGTCPGVSCVVHGGGGGGANSTGSYDTGAGGEPKAWLDGKYYSSGGNGSDASVGPVALGLYGNGGVGNDGGGFGFNCQGQPGYCKIRYTGSVALFTGGTTEISGGYVYHEFTSSGLFDYSLYP
jgi:hypothetical protein